MHTGVSEGVSGDLHVLDVDKKRTDWNSTAGTHWKELEGDNLSSQSKKGDTRPVT